MSDNSSSGAGGVSLVALVSGTFAYLTTPSLTGLQGVFGAAMIGSGTSIAAGVGALALGLVGLGVGGLVGGKGGALGLGFAMGLVGAGLGIYHGYGAAKDIVVNGTEPRAEITEPADHSETHLEWDSPIHYTTPGFV